MIVFSEGCCGKQSCESQYVRPPMFPSTTGARSGREKCTRSSTLLLLNRMICPQIYQLGHAVAPETALGPAAPPFLPYFCLCVLFI